jgi:hypothetical protein
LSDWRACFKVNVTSQNDLQVVVSKKYALADLRGLDLISIAGCSLCIVLSVGIC